jgi:hypothetical protein
MRNFVLWAITTFCRKNNIQCLFLNFNFTIFKKKTHVIYISYYNFVTIGIDIFQFYVSIISNLNFPFITYFLPFNDCIKNEKIVSLGFFFFFGFSTQLHNIISFF